MNGEKIDCESILQLKVFQRIIFSFPFVCFSSFCYTLWSEHRKNRRIARRIRKILKTPSKHCKVFSEYFSVSFPDGGFHIYPHASLRQYILNPPQFRADATCLFFYGLLFCCCFVSTFLATKRMITKQKKMLQIFVIAVAFPQSASVCLDTQRGHF